MILFFLNIFSHRKLKKLTDEELVAMYRNTEDLKVLGELFVRKTPMIASLSIKYMKHKEDAEDATYELFEVIKKDLLKHEVQNINAWLFSVTRNYCYRKLNKASKNLGSFLEDEKNPNSFMESEGEDDLLIKLGQEETLILMESCIEDLKEEQKVCVSEFYLKQKSYQEISDETGMELKKVKSHIQNGKRNLKILMDKRTAIE